MPPLKGVDRGIDGELLKVLEESGHGEQIVIVDPSYPIPEGARLTVDYHGESSAQALRGILKYLSIEKMDEQEHGPDVVFMAPDPPVIECDASIAFEEVANELKLIVKSEPRHPFGDTEPGFYAQANDPEKSSIFVRTRDRKAHACARFIVGHSQE